jgi:hypothetical protein
MISCHGGPKRLEISGGDAEDQIEGTFRKAELEVRSLISRIETKSSNASSIALLKPLRGGP